jgi:FkbM family methyltransferase
MSGVQETFIRLIAARRRSPPARALARGARAYLNAYANWSYDIASNGERRVLEIVAKSSPTCIFDVGANQGDWTLDAARTMPGASVHAFELIDETAERLRARVADHSVVVNAIGLSDREGEVQATFYPDATELSGITSSSADMHEAAAEQRTARVTTGDAYCREHHIKHIDFLKIDAEGADLNVLRGFDELLLEGGVDALQFEYGRVNILTHNLLRDFHLFLEDRGFTVGKVFPDHVDFREYTLLDEDFLGPNYVAVHSARADLLSALRG